jgi:hypothetical protein
VLYFCPLPTLAARLLVLLPLVTVLVGAAAATSPANTETRRATVWRADDIGAWANGSQVQRLGDVAVAHKEGHTALWFDGAGDGLVLPTCPLAGLEEFTVEMLIRPTSGGPEEQRFFHAQDVEQRRALLELRMEPSGRWCLDTFLFSGPARLTLIDRQKLHPPDRWTWVALVYKGGRMAHFVEGKLEAEGQIHFPPMSRGETSLGMRLNRVSWFQGGIAEVRVHPQALDASALARSAP